MPTPKHDQDIAFSPFQPRFEDIEASDLVVLRDTSEGWCVECKRELTKPAVIAKSISASANPHGGWVFYAVQESQDGHHRAEDSQGPWGRGLARYTAGDRLLPPRCRLGHDCSLA